MLRIVMPGTSKLGDVMQTSLMAGRTCPGASQWCALACYAKDGFYRMPSVKGGLTARTDLAEEDLAAYEALLRADLAKYRPTTLRIHAAGDFFGVEYIAMWCRVVQDHREIDFYGYTRSWNVPELLPALLKLKALPNMKLWASTDESMPSPPPEWREAKAFDHVEDARLAGFTVCPEQTGRKASCSDCGLCFKVTRPSFKLAFVKH